MAAPTTPALTIDLVEDHLESIIDTLGHDATMRALTNMLKKAEETSSKEVPEWKKQIERLTKKIEEADPRYKALCDGLENHLEKALEKECVQRVLLYGRAAACCDPYCDCTN